MSERTHTYAWQISLRHERQGFGKSVEVAAATSAEAMAAARESVSSARYPGDEFEVVELKRGRIVRVG